MKNERKKFNNVPNKLYLNHKYEYIYLNQKKN